MFDPATGTAIGLGWATASYFHHDEQRQEAYEKGKRSEPLPPSKPSIYDVGSYLMGGFDQVEDSYETRLDDFYEDPDKDWYK